MTQGAIGAADQRPARKAHLRLLADDLTGALDTAAQFAPALGPIPTFWRSGDAARLPATAAFDHATREADETEARRIVDARCHVLAASPDRVSYLKMDSLMRGHTAIELARCIAFAPRRRTLIAPAFPYQQRITRGGQQFARQGEAWVPVGSNIRALLETEGIAAQIAQPGMPAPDGVSVWDAETDDDLQQIARAGLAAGEPILWCGSAGLAGALAREFGSAAPMPLPVLQAPVLGLFGSDHPVLRAQLVVCEPLVLRIDAVDEATLQAASDHLADGVALVTAEMPAGMSRSDARARIGLIFATLLRHLPQPATLVVSGGETLRQVCEAVEADHLEIVGQFEPGIPQSLLRGGVWSGSMVVSKSGAFGDREFLRRLLAQVGENMSCH